MRGLLCALFLVAVSLGQCPLGLAPEEACPEASPRCALYNDPSGNGFCDNPGPLPVIDPEPVPDPEPEIPVEDEVPTMDEEPEPEPEPVVTVLTPQPDPVVPLVQEQPETGTVTEEEAPRDSVALVSSTPVFIGCPLNLSPQEACFEDSPRCALYTDETGDQRCDNPGSAEDQPADSVAAAMTIGCPLGLPPEAACPGDLALCPHWYGQSSGVACANPSGGDRRLYIALIALAVLLMLATFLSRRLRGRKLVPRLRRTVAHRTVQGLSLIVLGFGIQGCFCPLGAFQYAFLKDGLLFMGWVGAAILVLPFLFAAFFGRIFCCWVCPMGAVQEMAYLIPSPGKLNPRGKTSRLFGRFRFVVLGALVTILLLHRFEMLVTQWPAIFCRFDPFHTMFTLFLTGSVMAAGVTIALSVFVRRFFCRYLCFLGAALSLFTPLRLYSRITGRSQTTRTEDF